MKILILGGSGMLGHKLVQQLKTDFEVAATFRGLVSSYENAELFRGARLIGGIEAEDQTGLEAVLEKFDPDVVINAIGVIKQLPQSKDVVKILTVNSILPHRLAELAPRYDYRLITISTDCVFSGEKGDYVEEDVVDARDLYGKSKNLGEPAGPRCLTLRTSIIGRELSTSHSLLEWFLGQRGKTIKGFKKAIYTGFPTVVLAGILKKFILPDGELEGLYHVSSEKISKYALLELFNDAFEARVEIEPDEDFVLDRSLNSEKFRNLTGFRPLDWQTMVRMMAEDAVGYETK